MVIKRDIKDMEELLKTVMSKKIFSQDSLMKSKSFDYKQKEKEYYLKEIQNKVRKIKEQLTNIPQKETLILEKINNSLKVLETVYKEVNQQNIESAIQSLRKLGELVGCPPEKKENAQALQSQKEKDFNICQIPNVPQEIYQEVKANLDELKICFSNECYRSSLILCGKLLEIALHRKYFEITGKDLLEKSPDIGLGNLIARMRENNFALDPGLAQQIHLINQLRVYSVHKKEQVFLPSREQAHATILYTLDIIKKLFK